MDDSKLVNHICKKLQEVEIENYPYSHKFVENIFLQFYKIHVVMYLINKLIF